MRRSICRPRGRLVAAAIAALMIGAPVAAAHEVPTGVGDLNAAPVAPEPVDQMPQVPDSEVVPVVQGVRPKSPPTFKGVVRHYKYAPSTHFQPDPPTDATQGGFYYLPVENTNFPVTCAGLWDRQFVVLYAHLPGQDNYSTEATHAGSAFRRAHTAFVYNGSWSNGSGSTALRWPVTCSGIGNIEVSSCDFNTIRNTAINTYGYNAYWVKYVVFADCSNATDGGRADRYDDSTPSSSNLNAGVSAAQPMYAVIFRSGGWSTYAVLHEIGHTLGAVQTDAPFNNAHGHCNDGIDVMCYAEFGQPYSETRCTEAGMYDAPDFPGSPNKDPYFDCGHDTYFNDNPGLGSTYLGTHWNIPRSYDPFVLNGPSS